MSLHNTVYCCAIGHVPIAQYPREDKLEHMREGITAGAKSLRSLKEMGYNVQVMDLAFAGSREGAVIVTGRNTEYE